MWGEGASVLGTMLGDEIIELRRNKLQNHRLSFEWECSLLLGQVYLCVQQQQQDPKDRMR